ncbi:hypothetical protein [Planococcus halotolerans]|uniref:hypothetical protein n=1 Tax=Planococcus halotolerans TaxID=2233542 RepID=UPI0010925EF3|nr:hypothetical protein [Planococcus halotolerans]QHJ71306.1 hypothetical protein DNR44_012020 [Planococcus halotolerans]
MKILIAQPNRENTLESMRREAGNRPNVDVILFPEGYFQSDKLEVVSQLAKESNIYIVCGYKDENDKDRAFMVNQHGKVLLERAKTPDSLFAPSKIEDEGRKFGYVLCREIFLGLKGLGREPVDIIFNPIGVGMFSEEQFTEWTDEARKIAIEQKAFVIGVSHSDGSYRDCGFSIPIAYGFDQNGKEVLMLKNDMRSVILDTELRAVEYVSVS